MKENLALAKKMNVAAWVISAAVLLLVGLMRRVKINLPEGWNFDFLPPFYSGLNIATALVLIIALWFVRRKNIEMHQKAIYLALGLSFIFLLSYVVYHFTMPETLFGDANHNGVLDEIERAAVGGGRTVYLLLLLSHIVLAALTFPFILFTFIKGYTGQVEKHRKMARWVFPLWLYVAITGPIIYFMLMPYY